jgi:hypothetical protein
MKRNDPHSNLSFSCATNTALVQTQPSFKMKHICHTFPGNAPQQAIVTFTCISFSLLIAGGVEEIKVHRRSKRSTARGQKGLARAQNKQQQIQGVVGPRLRDDHHANHCIIQWSGRSNAPWLCVCMQEPTTEEDDFLLPECEERRALLPPPPQTDFLQLLGPISAPS